MRTNERTRQEAVALASMPGRGRLVADDTLALALEGAEVQCLLEEADARSMWRR